MNKDKDIEKELNEITSSTIIYNKLYIMGKYHDTLKGRYAPIIYLLFTPMMSVGYMINTLPDGSNEYEQLEKSKRLKFMYRTIEYIDKNIVIKKYELEDIE